MDEARGHRSLKIGVALIALAGTGWATLTARAEPLISSFPQCTRKPMSPRYGVEPYGGTKMVRKKHVHPPGKSEEEQQPAVPALTRLVRQAAVMAAVMFWSSDEDNSSSSSSSSSSGSTGCTSPGINDAPEPATLVGGLIGGSLLGWFGLRRRRHHGQRTASKVAG